MGVGAQWQETASNENTIVWIRCMQMTGTVWRSTATLEKMISAYSFGENNVQYVGSTVIHIMVWPKCDSYARGTMPFAFVVLPIKSYPEAGPYKLLQEREIIIFTILV